jgi:hypothetical protein
MADEKQLIPILGIDGTGIVKDTPGHILPPNVFTDGKNVLFKNKSIQKRKGTVKAIPDVVTTFINVTNISQGGGVNQATITFADSPALAVGNTFQITGTTPAVYSNVDYTVFSVSDDGKVITITNDISGNLAYATGGTYSFAPVTDFLDYWPALQEPQYIEVQRNAAVTPNVPVFNSIRAVGNRERINFASYEVESISPATSPVITFKPSERNVLQGLLSGDVIKIIGSSVTDYNTSYTVSSVTYVGGKTVITCSAPNASGFAAYTSNEGAATFNSFKPTSYDGITSQDWQSTFFAGGYAYIINDGYHTPQYLLSDLSSGYTTPNLESLPGWDWQRAAGSDTHIGAKVVRGYRNVLIAGNLSEYPITTGVPSLNASKRFPGTIRVSVQAPAGEIPTTWKPGATNLFANEFELSTTSAVQDIVPLQGVAMIYTSDSIHSLQFDARGNESVQTIIEGYGALETGCVLEFDGKHLVIGADDIYLFAGHPASIQSVCDGKVRNYFYNNLNPIPANQDNIFMVRDVNLDEIHIYYPTKKSVNGECNEYLAWNYRNNTWSINECDNLVSGVSAPVRGAGVAGGDVVFSGEGNTTSAAQQEIQTLTVDNFTGTFSSGTNEVQTFDYTANETAVASTYAEEEIDIVVNENIVPYNNEEIHFDINSSFDSGVPNRIINTFTGTGTSTNIDNTGITVTKSQSTRPFTIGNLGQPTGASLPQNNGYLTLTSYNKSNQRFTWAGNWSSSNRESKSIPSRGYINRASIQLSTGGTTYIDRYGGWLWPDDQNVSGNAHEVLFQFWAERESSGGAYAFITLKWPNDVRADAYHAVQFWNDNGDKSGYTNYIRIEGAESGNINESGTSPNGPLPSTGTQTRYFIPGRNNSVTFKIQVPRDHDSSVSMAHITIMCAAGNGVAAEDNIIERPAVKYTVSGCPAGSNINTVIDGVTILGNGDYYHEGKVLSESSLSYTLNGTVPISDTTGTHNGAKPATIESNIQTFSGLNLTSETAQLNTSQFSYSPGNTVFANNQGGTTGSSTGTSLPSVAYASAANGSVGNYGTYGPSLINSSNTGNPSAWVDCNDLGGQWGFTPQIGRSSYIMTFDFGAGGSISGTWSYATDFRCVQANSSGVDQVVSGNFAPRFNNAQGAWADDSTVHAAGYNNRTFAISCIHPTNPVRVQHRVFNGIQNGRVNGYMARNVSTISTGLQEHIRYKLTNSSPTNFSNASLLVGGITQNVNTLGNAAGNLDTNEVFQVDFPYGFNVSRNYTVSLGQAAQFSFSGTSGSGFGDLTNVNLPGGLNATQTSTFLKDYLNQNGTNLTATSDGTVLKTYFTNASATAADQGLSFTQNSGSNTSATKTTVAAHRANFSRYRFRAFNSDGTEVFEIDRTLTSSYITPTQIGEYLRDEIINAANASINIVDENEWYDNNSGLDAENNYLIKIGTADGEAYSLLITDITTGITAGNVSGTNNALTFSSFLSSDSSGTPDTAIFKDPNGNTLMSFKLGSGETIDEIFDRIHDEIVSDNFDGWTSVHSPSSNTLVLTATQPGRYPAVSGHPTDSTLTNFSVFELEYTQGANVSSAGTLPSSLTSGITTQGSLESLQVTLHDPYRDYDDVVLVGGSTQDNVAEAIAIHVNTSWPNWNASSSGNVVTLTSKVSDWILKNRSDVTAYDVSFDDRAAFVKAISYAGLTDQSAVVPSGTFTVSSQSTNFVTTQSQVGHPEVLPTMITLSIDYESATDASEVITVSNTASAATMANDFKNRINSAAVQGLQASIPEGSTSTVQIQSTDYNVAINNISITFDEQSDVNNIAHVSRTSGNNISGSNSAPSINIATLKTRTDSERPYPEDNFNLSKFYPVVANATTTVAEGFGYAFQADPANNDTGIAYRSYVERIQLPIDNSVEYKKNVSYVQMLVDEGNIDFRISGSDAPGLDVTVVEQGQQTVDTLGATSPITFSYAEDYKVDVRENGRVFNIRLEDVNANIEAPTSTSPWRVSGIGYKTEPAESRGNR